jgi:hypothetical protein
MKTKVCGKCKIEKDLSLFNKRNDIPSGVRSTCKDCAYQYSRNRILKLKKDKPKEMLENITGRVCSKCNIYKNFCEYSKRKSDKYGVRSQCKLCDREYFIKNKDSIKEKRKEYYKNNREIIYKKNRAKFNKDVSAEYAKKYYNKNKNIIQERANKYRKENEEKIKKFRKEYYNNNKKQILEKQKHYYLENKENKIKYTKSWRKNNRSKWISARNKRKNERYKNDINFKLKSNITSRLNLALKHNKRSSRTEVLLGCTIQELKLYLESKFKEGMSWENRSNWHIDHILPCASFDLSKDEEQKKCFHYTNLQPLWKEENIKKSNKLEFTVSYE